MWVSFSIISQMQSQISSLDVQLISLPAYFPHERYPLIFVGGSDVMQRHLGRSMGGLE